MKPLGLKATTILMCIFNLCGYLIIDKSIGYVGYQILFSTIIIILSFVVIWYYWKGKNWARILVLIVSVLAILNLFSTAYFNLIQKIVVICEAIFACFLLYWLNTKQVKIYFSK